MATGEWDELQGTMAAQQVDNMTTYTRLFIVYGVQPKEAYDKATPSLPKIGDPFPKTIPTGADVGGRGHDTSFGPTDKDKYLQAREIRADYAAGNSNHSLIQIVYAHGEDWQLIGTQRRVLWEASSGSSSRRITHDIVTGAVIPNGGTVIDVPTLEVTARLRHSKMKTAHWSLAGSVNSNPFFGAAPGQAKYNAGTGALGIGYSVFDDGAHEVELSFSINPLGWKEERPRVDENGDAVLSDGAPVYDRFNVRPSADFQELFSNIGVFVDPIVFGVLPIPPTGL